MGRAPCCEKVGLKKGRWTAEEDEILTSYIRANGEGSWRSLPKNAGLLRCGKSCRLRWINYLRDDLKRGNISAAEEEVIIKLHGSHGNRWSLIASQLPGRTDNEIKNYWNSHLSRRIHTFRRADNDTVTIVMDIGRPTGGRKRRAGGRKSRLTSIQNSSDVDLSFGRDKKQLPECSHDHHPPILEPSISESPEKGSTPLSGISCEPDSEMPFSPLMAAIETNSGAASSETSDNTGIVTGFAWEGQSIDIIEDIQWPSPALILEDEWMNMDWVWEGVDDQDEHDKKAGRAEEDGVDRWSWLWEETDDQLLEKSEESEVERSYAAWLLSSSDANLS